MNKCPECGITEGHKILCKTGNARAKAYQNKLKSKFAKDKDCRMPKEWRGIAVHANHDSTDTNLTRKENLA